MTQRLLPLAFLVSMGCIPDNAEISSGSFKAFISESTSFTIVKEAIDLDTDLEKGLWNDNYSIDCRDLSLTEDVNGDGTNEDECEYYDNVIMDLPTFEEWTNNMSLTDQLKFHYFETLIF